MPAGKVCQSLQSRQERKEGKLLIFQYNLLPGWLGLHSVSCGYTSLAESPGQVQVKMCSCRYIQKLWGNGSGTSFSKWECLVATLVNIDLVREVLLINVAGRKIFSWTRPRDVGDIIHYTRFQFIVLCLMTKRGPAGWDKLVITGRVIQKEAEMQSPGRTVLLQTGLSALWRKLFSCVLFSFRLTEQGVLTRCLESCGFSFLCLCFLDYVDP